MADPKTKAAPAPAPKGGVSFFEKIEKLSKTVRIAICAGTLVLVVGLFVYFLYVPKYQKIGELKANLKKAEEELKEAKKRAGELKKVQDEMNAVQADFNLAKQELPEKEEIPSLLTGISRVGQGVGLEFLLFKPGKEEEREFYADIPVAIEVSGLYHETVRFFHEVSKLNRIVNIKDIRISGGKKGGGGKKGSSKRENELSVSCRAVTYKFIEAPPPPPPDKKGKDKDKTDKDKDKKDKGKKDKDEG